MTREETAAHLKEAALSIGKTVVMQILVQRFAFMGLAFVNPIVGLLVGYVLGIAIKETELGLFFNYIDMRTGNQMNEFETAEMTNFKVQQNGTTEEKANAEKILLDKFRSFARLTS